MYRDRLLFAAVESKPEGGISARFVRSYEKAAHKLLAEKQLAPALYGCEEGLKDLGWTIVVMEYFAPTDWVPLAVKSRAQRVKYSPQINAWGCATT